MLLLRTSTKNVQAFLFRQYQMKKKTVPQKNKKHALTLNNLQQKHTYTTHTYTHLLYLWVTLCSRAKTNTEQSRLKQPIAQTPTHNSPADKFCTQNSVGVSGRGFLGWGRGLTDHLNSDSHANLYLYLREEEHNKHCFFHTNAYHTHARYICVLSLKIDFENESKFNEHIMGTAQHQQQQHQ